MERLWIRVGVVGPLLGHVACYAAMLEARGYSARTVDGSVRLVAQLSRWLAHQGREACDLSPVLLEQFLQTRREAGYRTRSQQAYAPLLNHLYRRYLVRERGLVQTTVRAYVASASCFLAKRLEAGKASLEGLTPREVTEAVLAECRRRKPGSAKRWLTELRSLLRFLEIEGRTRTGLLHAVPGVPGWKGDSLPRYLTADDLARLLASCDQGSLVGRRDFAILTLLARLGLRSLEVANLTLDDLNWRWGEIVVQSKGHGECLPLPSDVGQALSAYLHDRPRASCRGVFLAVVAPIEGLDASGIRSVVRRACRRATAATHMLNAGASLAEVSQVLRHRDPQTTAMYAKVDQVSLRGLAQRWPGGVR
ncbi:MAG: tyrosine-type recombinase/integrase [Betaproteobacteria bacterium]|nr:tyrosine-type recombinase/integrase [Betaproteobacteria bacterium]